MHLAMTMFCISRSVRQDDPSLSKYILFYSILFYSILCCVFSDNLTRTVFVRTLDCCIASQTQAKSIKIKQWFSYEMRQQFYFSLVDVISALRFPHQTFRPYTYSHHFLHLEEKLNSTISSSASVQYLIF